MIRRLGKPLLALAGVLVALLVVELLMRGAGFYFHQRQLSGNQPVEADAGAVRILCLGESTTAEMFAEKRKLAWPRILERLLNQRSRQGKRYRVYNAAMPGLITSQIVAGLDQQLEHYRPQLVVSMIGINDRHLQTRYTGKLGQDVGLSLRNIRIYQLLRWLLGSYAGKTTRPARAPPPAGEPRPEDHQRYERLLQQVWAPINGGRPVEAERRLLRCPADHRAAAVRVAHELVNRLSEHKDRALFTRFALIKCRLERADLETLLHYTDELVDGLLPPGDETLSRRAIALFVSYHRSGKPVTRVAVSHFASIYSHMTTRDPRMDRILADRQLRKNDLLPYENTSFHYRAIHHKLQRRNIRYLAMAYPLTNIDALRSIFSHRPERRFRAFYEALQADYPPLQIRPRFRQVVFVGNRENFQPELRSRGWDALFTDRFGATFGHTTSLGHQLIAENLARTILKVMESSNTEKTGKNL